MLDGILEAFASFELWNRDGWDLDLLVWRLRVYAHAWSAGFGHEGAESSDRDLTTCFEGVGDDVDEGGDHVFGLFLANPRLFGDLVDELCFVNGVHRKMNDKRICGAMIAFSHS